METPMRSINSGKLVVLLLILLCLVGASFSAAPHQDKPIYKPSGGEATLVGTISFAGTTPEPFRIDTSADSVCEKFDPLMTGWIVVTDHKLANVVVYVRGEPLDPYSFETPSTTVTLEHRGCQYVPHVLGIQTLQTLKILNNDPTTQNTHAMSKLNPDWNQSQPVGSAPLELRFRSPELFVSMRDNKHPWEKAYVGVFSHPFFSVSGTDGSYKISGIPPGQYTIVAWHEKLGEQTLDLFLAGSEQKNLDFTFKASDH
jgi:hypothetical protein